ncbi:hypothetical protein ABW21_db0206572 [Orbilia brochopaga]|nr:hypothetical protein ABW21_db0206572 [Drechslerella brochopaga]
MSMLLTTSSPLFRTSTFGTVPLSPSSSPQSDDVVMDCPSSPSLFPRDIPSAPSTPGPTSTSSRSSYRPPNSAKRARRNTHVNTDPYPYPSAPMLQNPRRLSAIPTDNDVEVAYRNMSEYEPSSGSVSPMTRRKLPSRNLLQDSRLAPAPQLLSPLPLAPAPSFLPSAPTTASRLTTADVDDLNETLAQAIRLLSLEKKPESYPSTDASSNGSPHASISTSTSYAEDQYLHNQQFPSQQFQQSQSTLPDPEELLKEIVRNSLQSLHALRLAKAMERDIRSNRRSSAEETGMDVEGIGSAYNSQESGTAMQVVAYLEQSVSTINSARQYIRIHCATHETVFETH